MNLRKRRLELDMTLEEVGRIVGVGKSTVRKWETGDIANMKIDKVALLAKALRTTPDRIMGTAGEPDDPQPLRVPVCNSPGETRFEELPAAMAAKGEYFALAIQDGAMAPRILAGDVVIVRRQQNASDGDFVVATVSGGTPILRKLTRQDSGVGLIPLNSNYSPRFFTAGEQDSLPVVILGKAVQLRGNIE